jgi:hypothetical protein
MRLLKGYFHIVIAAILVLTLFIVPVAAELKSTQTDDGKTLISNGTYWISWDPIGDHIVGDQFFINGTTILSAGTDIYYDFLAPSGSCRTKICTGKSPGIDGDIILKPGTTPGINTFSLLINTTDLQSNWYVFLFQVISSDNLAEVDAFHQYSQVDSSILLFPEDWQSITAHPQTTHPDAGISYWMSVSNMVVEYTRPCFQLTGTTNLPQGETLSYSFFSPIEFGPNHNIDPIKDVQGLYHGGTVVQGEKPGINRFIIPINTDNLTEWTNVIIWNPRYNTSDPRDTISTSTEFHPSPDAQNVSTTCSATLPVTTPASPLSVMGTCGALFVILYIGLLIQRKEKRRLR